MIGLYGDAGAFCVANFRRGQRVARNIGRLNQSYVFVRILNTQRIEQTPSDSVPVDDLCHLGHCVWLQSPEMRIYSA
jgi:hypothetical protein